MINYCQLARLSLETWVTQHHKITRSEKTGIQAGCFVSLHLDGELRGCIGTISPVHDDLVQEIIENAISAGVKDPRFPPVNPSELSALEIEVSVLYPPEPVSNTDQLNAQKYGIIITQGYRRGVLLPDLEGVNTVADQMRITKQKANIFNDDPVQLERFEVQKFHES